MFRLWSGVGTDLREPAMKFEITRTSIPFFSKEKQPVEGAVWEDDTWFIEIATLEDLLSLSDAVGSELVIGIGSIEIYDDYRE